MGGQKISSRRRYDSSSGHAFIIGVMYKVIIGMFLYSKAVQKCYDGGNKVKEAEEHECPNNFNGRSKIMESGAIINLVEDAFICCCFIIDIVVSDYDITLQAVLKHP